ncbi:MAG: ABC transporter ATP-binding protein [Desulfobacterales bacterium]|nr:ABC transporter ATP-binding protein [Desulfobacterales bacterium]
MIELRDLSKTYGTTRAVDRISLKVPKGELFGFIGPNGAGKTTTIRMIGGLLAPSHGTVVIDGIDMAANPVEAKRRIGLIPDRPFLYEKLTGMEFMRFTADLYDVAEERFHTRTEELLTLFGLLGRAHELIESYSHGMKQRLIMAASLLHEPPILIVDEPMVGLDPRGIRMVRELFGDLAANGTTIFMSTHTLKLAEDVCHQIGIINHGTLVATGTIDDLKLASGVAEADLEGAFLQLTREGTDP